MPAIIFDLPGIPPSANKRMHHMARYRSNKEWAGWARQALISAINTSKVTQLPWDGAHVEYIFHYPRTTLADIDNLIASTKPILDACKVIVVPDDSARYVHAISARVVKDGGQRAGLTVVITRCVDPLCTRPALA